MGHGAVQLLNIVQEMIEINRIGNFFKITDTGALFDTTDGRTSQAGRCVAKAAVQVAAAARAYLQQARPPVDDAEIERTDERDHSVN